ncbi:hypothetical protein [Actinoplanes sp. OR16]|uniref:hypothetical protein n=1 Tax=Actinoplanes sp. OR16 TaxID=946334 RepID=UPI000FDB9C26|nr:hypothetical protein [Actinoplanes sp. OR16]
MRLPLDDRSARSVRRYVGLRPWILLISLLAVPAWLILVYADLPRTARLIAHAVIFMVPVSQLCMHFLMRGLPPFPTQNGDLRIPRVPVEVAHAWIGSNPGVSATACPAPRARPRRFYVGWALTLVPVSIGLALWMANNGREDAILLWMLVPALFTVGIVMALRIPTPVSGRAVRTWPPGV